MLLQNYGLVLNFWTFELSRQKKCAKLFLKKQLELSKENYDKNNF